MISIIRRRTVKLPRCQKNKRGIENEYENKITTIAIDGRLDTLTAPELTTEINTIAPESDKIILDVSHLEYISSAGIRALVTAHKLMAGKDGFTIKAPNENVMEIIKLTGLTAVLDIVE